MSCPSVISYSEWWMGQAATQNRQCRRPENLAVASPAFFSCPLEWKRRLDGLRMHALVGCCLSTFKASGATVFVVEFTRWRDEERECQPYDFSRSQGIQGKMKLYMPFLVFGLTYGTSLPCSPAFTSEKSSFRSDRIHNGEEDSREPPYVQPPPIYTYPAGRKERRLAA